MTNKIATTKQTAGDGFVFENKVVAYYLVWMLSGTAPLKSSGQIGRIDCQVAADGWHGFDDLLITINDNGCQRRIAFSVKSNLQFRKDSAPRDLVEAAWKLFLHQSSQVMDTEKDSLGLICVPHPDPPKIAIQRLLMKAKWQTPRDLANRLPEKGYASSTERNIHSSCACPMKLSGSLQEDEKLPGHLLKLLMVVELDFEHVEPFSEANARFICSEIVESGSPEDAGNLWNALCQIADRMRTAGGGITREELIQKVRTSIRLRDFPDFARDWEKLSAWCKSELALIPDRIAKKVMIKQDDLIAQIIYTLESSRFVSLVGASGTGKSVIAKLIAQEHWRGENILWLRGERVRPGYIESLASRHGLGHSLEEVLRNSKREGGLIVLDNSERLLNDNDFVDLARLLNMVAMETTGCGWRLLITCREEAWDRVACSISKFLEPSIIWSPVRVDYPKFEMLSPVWKEFPTLRALAIRPHLSQVMRNLKVLDLLASAINMGQSPDTNSLVGESQLIAWYWQYVVRDGERGRQRDVLIQKIATNNADSGRFEILEADLSSDELKTVEGSSNLLKTDSDRGTVSFVHDLIADWARYKTLIAHKNDFASYLEHRFTNPHWYTALRFYGLSLLESDPTGEQWKAAVVAYPEEQNCFLESIVFASNLSGLLDNIWPVFTETNGELLKAFLKRFQYVATIPNPQYVAKATQIGISPDEARTWERIPLWMYWIGLLSALTNHISDILTYVPFETSRLARTWLRYTPRNWPGRQQAAELAIAVAHNVLRARCYSHHSDETARLPYTALLEAYPDQPDTVQELLLKLAARVVPQEDDGELFARYKAPGTVTHMQSFMPGGELVAQEPWPDGPLFRVNDIFRASCLETDALCDIMNDAPDLAREIILALLIEYPSPKMTYDFNSRSMLGAENVGLEDNHSFYPRFYTKGPFLLFLRTNTEVGLHAIIDLVDFATERWMDYHYPKDNCKTGFDILLPNEKKCFIGDGNVFHWYHGYSDSNVISSALMAAEKWLYDCLDEDQEIDQWLGLILQSSHSAAFLGMLCEVGRYAPYLFSGVLRPLLLVPDIYYMETEFAVKGETLFGTPLSCRDGDLFIDLATKWDKMEHRKYRLVNIACYLFHRCKGTREALMSAREGWINMVTQSSSPLSLHTEALIATFDDNNWKEVELPDGRKRCDFIEPENLKPPPDQVAKSEKQMLLLTLPMDCRKMIDEGSRIDINSITAFVQRTKDLIGFEPDDQEVIKLSPIANSLLGTVAVLFLLHKDWLRNNPNEEKWCLEVLDQVLAEPPPWPEYEFPNSAGNHDWEHFACEVAPIIWAECPDDKTAHERVARLAFAKHYSAAAILLSRAFEKRQELGDRFWQLVNLLLEWSVIRFDIHDAQYEEEQKGCSQRVSDVCQRFLEGKVETSTPRWGEDSIKQGKVWARHNHPRYLGKDNLCLLSRVPRIDMQQIQATFCSLLLPAKANDDSERVRFLEFWDQAMIVCLAGARFVDEEGNDISSELTEAGIPNGSERRILERLAIVVGQMRLDEKPERYWKPILSLGSHARHWVEHFLDHWFIDARNSMLSDEFAKEWIRMIDFCLNSETWREQSRHTRFHTPQLWMSLIGLPQFATSLWEDDDAVIVNQAGDYIEHVIRHVLPSARDAAHLLSWLTTTSGEGIRCRLLKPIADTGLKAPNAWWNERNLVRTMTQYLNSLWDKHMSYLDQNQESKDIFLSLIHRAAKTQEPLALELQKRIAQHA